MSRVIADGLSKRATATTAEAEAGTADKYPDAAGVHAAFGQYGLGANTLEIMTDANAPTKTGFYDLRFDALNKPGDQSMYLWHTDKGSGFTAQIIIGYGGNQASDTNTMYVRHKDNGAWENWHEIYNQSSILGTVSQSAGVPTGSIIETGSNGNGTYTKFADGTLICTGPLYNLAETFIWTHPATFVGEARISATSKASGTPITITAIVNVDSSNIYHWDTTNTAPTKVANSAYLLAIGRWW